MSTTFIVLSTYQGVEYVCSLIESIRQQSHADWALLIRDDGSQDGTARFLADAAAEDKRVLLMEGGDRCGAAGSFGLLMQRAHELGAEYLFFADQDDVWHEDKLRQMLAQMCQQEVAQGQRLPHLVYSDLVVVDTQMRMVAPSFLRCSRLRHGEGRPLRTLLGRSFVLGCACVVNRPLLEFALPMPHAVASHDWWVALCAASIGHISYLPQPMIWYRRHGTNASGPASFWAGFNPWKHSWSKRWDVGWQGFLRSLDQAQELRKRLRLRLPNAPQETVDLLDRFCALFVRPDAGWRRVLELCRLGIPAIDLPRRFLYYLCVLKLPRRTKPR